jgi:hypothetical protein
MRSRLCVSTLQAGTFAHGRRFVGRFDRTANPDSRSARRTREEISEGELTVENDRIARVARRLALGLPRRTAIALFLGASPLPWLAGPFDADAARQERRDGEPGPQPPKCSKLNGKCFVSGDCCGPGTRCKKAGRNKCRCKRDRSPCAGICCPVGQSCCGRCADLQVDPDNCGACFIACGTDETCVAGICTS